eukprot:UN02704
MIENLLLLNTPKKKWRVTINTCFLDLISSTSSYINLELLAKRKKTLTRLHHKILLAKGKTS